MAGLWDRMNGNDSVACHLIVECLGAYATGLWTKATILGFINDRLVTPLDTASETDLDNICAAIDALPDATAKLVYNVEVTALMHAAQLRVINETAWRTDLGIS